MIVRVLDQANVFYLKNGLHIFCKRTIVLKNESFACREAKYTHH